jgi:hypothetical protein
MIETLNVSDAAPSRQGIQEAMPLTKNSDPNTSVRVAADTVITVRGSHLCCKIMLSIRTQRCKSRESPLIGLRCSL